MVKIRYPFTLPENPDNALAYKGSCNGLICVTYQDELEPQVVLWNPTTNKYWRLPHSPSILILTPTQREVRRKEFSKMCYWQDRIEYGFLYDETSSDYKVLRLVELFRIEEIDHPGQKKYAFNQTQVGRETTMYSLKSNSWKRLPPDTFPDFMELEPHEIGPGVLINNTLHWVMVDKRQNVWRYKYLIVALNLTTEKSYSISPPADDALAFARLELGVSNGCLTFLTRYSHDISYLWIMKEYGERNPWTKYRLHVPHWGWYPRFIGYPSGTGNKLCFVDAYKLVCCDAAPCCSPALSTTDSVGEFLLPSREFILSNLESIRRGCLFTHSLVIPRPSCDGMKGNEELGYQE
ncbi:OLC1v1014511C1 [Oldenlandia corymbosa var. corymbosa]|uniref:OLC1v1014511C1 n=1 Tax=Oldenlandia corymbosa var. corymbosa TaxID=529605 RepID=A0AAV1E0V2_OLDCO|nr:OLC1v1014511C1 [Oldenlandia corymbosa var. corymbosa]